MTQATASLGSVPHVIQYTSEPNEFRTSFGDVPVTIWSTPKLAGSQKSFSYIWEACQKSQEVLKYPVW